MLFSVSHNVGYTSIIMENMDNIFHVLNVILKIKKIISHNRVVSGKFFIYQIVTEFLSINNYWRC
jgi:hypothetical protein